MIKTRLCDLLEIEVPIIQAAIWPATSPALVAAVGEAGAIGSIGAVFGSAEGIAAEIAAVRSSRIARSSSTTSYPSSTRVHSRQLSTQSRRRSRSPWVIREIS